MTKKNSNALGNGVGFIGRKLIIQDHGMATPKRIIISSCISSIQGGVSGSISHRGQRSGLAVTTASAVHSDIIVTITMQLVDP